jgi:Uma2 family endonuclease
MQARDELTVVPRWAVSLPLAVEPPPGFRADDPATWPQDDGRFEYAAGKLWYMPPCADRQQQTVVDAVGVLAAWRTRTPGFVVGSNEAGMLLGGEVRAADVAVWRRADLGAPTGTFPRVPPVLAVEVAGRDDTVELLADKARWYLDHGVQIVWILDPAARSVLVIDRDGETRLGPDGAIAARDELPGLAPRIAAFFVQIDGR